MRTWTLCCWRPLDVKLSVITAHSRLAAFVIVKTIKYSCTNYSNCKITNNELLVDPNRGFININKTIRINNDIINMFTVSSWDTYKQLVQFIRTWAAQSDSQQLSYSHTHSYNDGGGCRATCQLLILGFNILLKEASTCSQKFEATCYRLLDVPPELLWFNLSIIFSPD